MNDEFDQKYAKRNNALDECGIGHDVFDGDIRTEIEAAQKFCAEMANKMVQQIIYDYTTNVPCCILTRAECKGHGIKHGIVSGFSAHVKWDINAVIKMCGDMLEDVNAHTEAAQVRAMLPPVRVNP